MDIYDPVRAYFLFMEARHAGLQIQGLDADTFNAVVQVAATHADAQTLAELIESMEAQGVSVQPATLGSIAQSYAAQGDAEACIGMVAEMQQKGGKGGAEFYHTLADLLSAHGHKQELMDELVLMMTRDNVTWSHNHNHNQNQNQNQNYNQNQNHNPTHLGSAVTTIHP